MGRWLLLGGMNLKKRWIAGLVVFLLTAALLVPQLAANLDHFLKREMSQLTMNPLDGWAAIISSSRVFQLYLLLDGLVAVLLGTILLTGSSLDYRSKMWVVTPDIITPCADGQGQFGTAKWLKKADIPRFYKIWRVPGKNDGFQKLMQAGEQDREEIKNAKL